MKKRLCIFWILASILLISEAACAKIEVPGRTKNRINDYAGVLDDDTKQYLERLVSSIEQKTSDPAEVMVSTFKSLEGWNFRDFAGEYGERWRLSKTGRDNGVIVIVVTDEGRADIGVGRNLSGVLPADVIKKIVNDKLLPKVAERAYAAGIKDTVETIVDILNKATIPAENPRIVLRNILIIGIILLLFFLLSLSRDGSS